MDPIRFDIKLDSTTLADVENSLRGLEEKAPVVFARALNKTAKDARKKLHNKVKETYVIKAGAFNKGLALKSATAGNLTAVLSATGQPIALSKFSYRSNSGSHRGDSPAKAKVLRANSLKPLLSSFGGGAFVQKVKAGNSGRFHSGIWQREGRERTPIRQLYSLSVPDMLGGVRVWDVLQDGINDDLDRNVQAEIDKLIARITS